MLCYYLNLFFVFNLGLIHKLSKAKTRHSSITNISEFIGPGKDFIPNKQPTNRAVIKKIILLKGQKKKKHATYAKVNILTKILPMILVRIFTLVFPLVLAQWKKANIKFQQPVIIGEKSPYYRIKTIWEKVENVAWGRTKAKVKEEVILKLDKLIDLTILLCENDLSGCSSEKHCKHITHIYCTCIFTKKIIVTIWF